MKDDRQRYSEAVEKLNAEYIAFENEVMSSKLYSTQKRIKELRYRSFKKNVRMIYHFMLASIHQSRSEKQTEMSQNYAKGALIEGSKGVVFTCITNNYDVPLTPYFTTTDLDFICFSDGRIEQYPWKFKPVPDKIMNKSGTYINRYLKVHPFEFLTEYDYSVYVDGSVRIVSDVRPLYYMAKNAKAGIALHKHSVRNNVYEEAKECIYEGKGRKAEIKKQINKYLQEKFPNTYPLYEATVIVVDLKNPNARRLLDEWWKEFNESGSGRDQLALPYVLWKQGYSEKDIGILGDNVLKNPKFHIYGHTIK